MTDYHFLNLSPYEFEILSRDLLQANLKIRLEAFGSGADKGIDLRYTSNGNLIVQCKRYKDYNSLYSDLKKEVSKVQSLQPDKYLLTTSVSLTPSQKEKIKELFIPFIKDISAIYSREDLNNLLNIHPEIEKSHYKLWLSSSNVLQTIINSQIVNQSRFVFEEIKSKIRLYVQNDSFFDALNIIKNNKYVIISGIPGIGKTTLAQILVYHFLGKGIEEFIFLSDTINQGFQLFKENKSQVFLFDDFLGRNFLQNSININEEGQIIRFISMIQKSENKILIFTTREYILNQAKLRLEHFDNIQFQKCIMDLSKYTTFIKAKILYNHLYFNDIPFNYIKELINQKYLFEIIKHPNYSPRIIESFTQSKLWNSYSAKDFPRNLKQVFDYPDTIWKHAFENQISELSRYLLYCLVLFNGEIDFDNLYEQLKEITKHVNTKIGVDYLSFKKSLREIDNSFIKIKRDYKNNLIISFQNPSIQDFLIKYIDDDLQLKKNFFNSSNYLKPLLELFSNKREYSPIKNRLTLNQSIEDFFIDKIIESYNIIDYSPQLNKYYKPSQPDIEVLKLSSIVFNMEFTENSKMKNFVIEKLKPLIYSKQIGNKSVNEFYTLIDKFSEELQPDMAEVISNIIDAIWDYDDLWILKDFETNYPDDYEKFIEKNNDIYNEILETIADDIASSNSENLQENIDLLKELEDDFYIETHDYRSEIERAINEREEEKYFHDEDYFGEIIASRAFPDNYEKNITSGSITKIPTEEEKIENMFNSME